MRIKNKMKLFYTFWLTLTLATYANITELNEEVEATDIIKMKCEKISGEHAYPSLLAAAHKAKCCLNIVKENKSEETFQGYCEDASIPNLVYECVKPVGEKLLDCLEEEESYLPDFLFSALNYALVEFCGDEGRQKLDYIMESLEDTQCFSSNFNTQKMANDCFPNFAIFKTANGLNEKSFTEQKSDICVDVVNLQNCIDNSIKEQCFGKDHGKMVQYILEPFLSLCYKNA